MRPAHFASKCTVPVLNFICNQCKHSVGYAAAQYKDIPVELRVLSSELLRALRPLTIDVGPEIRHTYGYRVHARMCTFMWNKESVQSTIRKYTGRQRQKLQTAYDMLMERESSSHRTFISKHNTFLLKTERKPRLWNKKLPLGFIENVGLECALWPNLYHTTNMCPSYIRHTDCGRQQRLQRRSTVRHSSTSSASTSTSSGESEPDVLHEQHNEHDRGSAKSKYMTQVLSEVVGYGCTFELFQFVYDLWLWTTVGAAKNSTRIPLRLALAGRPFTADFWRIRHSALLDMQRQLGYPTIFFYCRAIRMDVSIPSLGPR